jgi:hypothetical protein
LTPMFKRLFCFCLEMSRSQYEESAQFG